MATKTQSKVTSGKPQIKRKSTTKSSGSTAKAAPRGQKIGAAKAQRTDIDLNHFRELLIEERKRLEEELEQVRNRHTDMDNALPEEGEGGDEDTADLAAAMQDKEFDLSVEDEIEDILAQVDRAFQKFEEGTYGICDVSGKDIPVNRLEAIPYATLTVECQSLSEG